MSRVAGRLPGVPASVSPATALRVTEAGLRLWRRTWHANAFTAFVSPVLFLVAMGLGLGSLVDAGPGSGGLAGLSYVSFVGTGLLAATTMQNAASESAWPVMMGVKWTRTYHAVVATPVGPAEIALGHTATVAVKTGASALVFAVVMTLFDVAGPARSLLAVLPAVATGLAVGPAVVAYTSLVEQDQALAYLFRFGIVPMFLLSGTFFPVAELPGWVRPVAWATPLWHGVQLTRSAAAGVATVLPAGLHAAYLAAWTVAGLLAAMHLLRRRLTS